MPFARKLDPRNDRLTISVSKTEKKEIKDRAKPKSVSEYLISCSIGSGYAPLNLSVHGEATFSLGDIEYALKNAELPAAYLESLPLALREAVDDYFGALRRGGEDFAQALRREDAIAKQLPYGPEHSITAFQAKARDVLITLLDDIGQIEPHEGSAGSESHFARSGLFSSRRIIYLYPFYRSPSRRPFWGVIPYGCHRKTGLLVHKDIAAALTTTDLPKGAASTGWLGLTLNKLCEKSERRLGFAEGFFEEEIAEVIWSKSQTKHVFDFENHRTPLPAHQLNLNEPKNLCAYLEKQKVKLLVFDLSFRNGIQAAISKRSDWTVISYPHGADVPVGIGFTLSFLPRLLIHDNWKKIYDFSVRETASFRKALETSGIEDYI